MPEVIVAGGGPAGLAAAIAARQAGLDVSVFDRARPPIDKACGEGIMPDGLAALARLGVTIPAAQACSFRGPVSSIICTPSKPRLLVARATAYNGSYCIACWCSTQLS